MALHDTTVGVRPVSPEDREKIAHKNADALLRLVPRQ
jgi:predicted TIM-barrel fold metal-dependent hydrolase